MWGAAGSACASREWNCGRSLVESGMVVGRKVKGGGCGAGVLDALAGVWQTTTQKPTNTAQQQQVCVAGHRRRGGKAVRRYTQIGEFQQEAPQWPHGRRACRQVRNGHSQNTIWKEAHSIYSAHCYRPFVKLGIYARSHLRDQSARARTPALLIFRLVNSGYPEPIHNRRCWAR